MDIGSKLKNARVEKGLTQEQAAEALFVSRQTVSNWENGKTFPDILSVVRMSGLYSVSLDHLLKEEPNMKQSYLEYLEESTNTVKSSETRAKVVLVSVTLGIWALCVLAFWLRKDSADPDVLGTIISGAILPVLFFSASYIIGKNGFFSRWKWIAAPLCSALYALSGSITTIDAGSSMYRAVRWPDLSKLPAGLLIALAGLAAGCLIRRKGKKPAEG